MLTPKIGKSEREPGFENPDIIIKTVHLSICLVFCLLALFSILLMNFLGWEVEYVCGISGGWETRPQIALGLFHPCLWELLSPTSTFKNLKDLVSIWMMCLWSS